MHCFWLVNCISVGPIKANLKCLLTHSHTEMETDTGTRDIWFLNRILIKTSLSPSFPYIHIKANSQTQIHTLYKPFFSDSCQINQTTLKFGGTMVLPAGIWRTMLSASKSQRSHWEWLVSRAQGNNSTRRVLKPVLHAHKRTCMGLSHWATGSVSSLHRQKHIKHMGRDIRNLALIFGIL